MSDSQSVHPSRLSKTNRADPHDGEYGPSTAKALNQPLTTCDGVSLRTDVIRGNGDGIEPETWRNAVWTWRDWYEDSRDSKVIFADPEGNEVSGSDPNRFHPDYGDKQYAKLKDLERGVKAEYGKQLHTGMLTLSASSMGDGGPIPPVDHLNSLLASYDAVRRSLSRVLDGNRWEYLAILEPHKSGYLHLHIAVFVEGAIVDAMFQPVVDAHLRNCKLAEKDAHDVEDDGVVSTRWAGGDRDTGDGHIDELAIYLAEYLGTYGDDPLDQAEHVQMANSLLWATGRQRWRPSNGAQQYMSTNRSPPDPDWDLVGIEDASGELHEVDGGGGGGANKIRTWIPDRGPPPD
jgi:hypothetical protein